MKVAFVVPRYGPDGHRWGRDGGPAAGRAPGGPEGVGGRGAHRLCRRLRHLGRRVLPEGDQTVNGVRGPALRLGVRSGPVLPPVLGLAARRPGPGLPGGGGAVGRSPGAGGPRRWWRRPWPPTPTPSSSTPTSTTRRSGPSGRCGSPTVLHPAAHDEPALHLPVFADVFDAADGLVFQTTAERHLVEGTFAVATHRQLLLGLGVDDPDDLRHRRRPIGRTRSRPATPVPALPRAGRPPQGHLAAGRPLRRLQGAPSRDRSDWSSPARWSRLRPTIPRSTSSDRCRTTDKWALLARGGGPGVPVGLGGVLAGGGRGMERPDAGAGQCRLCCHRRALPPVGRRAVLRRLRRVRGPRSTCCAPTPGSRRPSAGAAGPTSTVGSAGPGSSTGTPTSSRSVAAHRSLTDAARGQMRASGQMPWPSGRGPARIDRPGRRARTRRVGPSTPGSRR